MRNALAGGKISAEHSWPPDRRSYGALGAGRNQAGPEGVDSPAVHQKLLIPAMTLVPRFEPRRTTRSLGRATNGGPNMEGPGNSFAPLTGNNLAFFQRIYRGTIFRATSEADFPKARIRPPQPAFCKSLDVSSPPSKTLLAGGWHKLGVSNYKRHGSPSFRGKRSALRIKGPAAPGLCGIRTRPAGLLHGFGRPAGLAPCPVSFCPTFSFAVPHPCCKGLPVSGNSTASLQVINPVCNTTRPIRGPSRPYAG